MPPNVHPAAWELISQTRNAYVHDDDGDSSWEEREHNVLIDECKRLHQQHRWPFFDKNKSADAIMSPQLMEALSSVRVLDDPAGHEEWLDKYNGSLSDMSLELLKGLR